MELVLFDVDDEQEDGDVGVGEALVGAAGHGEARAGRAEGGFDLDGEGVDAGLVVGESDEQVVADIGGGLGEEEGLKFLEEQFGHELGTAGGDCISGGLGFHLKAEVMGLCATPCQ